VTFLPKQSPEHTAENPYFTRSPSSASKSFNVKLGMAAVPGPQGKQELVKYCPSEQLVHTPFEIYMPERHAEHNIDVGNVAVKDDDVI
jgi:hypothetical protein